MKHTLKSYLAALAIVMAAGLGSCTRFDDSVKDDRPTAADGKGFVSVTVNTGSGVASRAGTDPGEEAEYRVNRVRMVLYDPASLKVKYAFDFDIATNPAPSTGDYYLDMGPHGDNYTGDQEPNPVEYDPNGGRMLYDESPLMSESSFVTFARQVDNQDYKMVVILNPPVNIGEIIVQRSHTRGDGPEPIWSLEKITAEGHHLDEFLAPMPMSREHIYHSNYGGIGADGNFYMTNSGDLVDVKKEQLAMTPEDANDNPIAVSVERAVAKVIVTYPGTGPTVTAQNATIGELRWDIEHHNNYFYWMRKPAPLITEVGTEGVLDSQTPHDRKYRYAEDPNFRGLTDANGGSEDKRIEHFSSTAVEYGTPSPLFHRGKDDRVLVTENTMAADEQEPEVMTRVVVGVPYSPGGDIPALTGTEPEGESYFVFNGAVITFEMMKKYLRYEEMPPDGLQDVFDKLQWHYGSDLDGLHEGFDRYGLKFYYLGMHYYFVNIRHFAHQGAAGQSPYGKYGVVRNNVYTVSINNIHGPGSPVVSDPAFLSGFVYIMPWWMNQQRINLGQEAEVVGRDQFYVTYRYYYEVQYNDGQIRYIPYDSYVVRGLSENDPINPDQTLLDKFLSNVNALGEFTYDQGELFNYKTYQTPTEVSADPENNIVEVIYRVNNPYTFIFLYSGNVLEPGFFDPIPFGTANVNLQEILDKINRGEIVLPHGFALDDNPTWYTSMSYIYPYEEITDGQRENVPVRSGEHFLIRLRYIN